MVPRIVILASGSSGNVTLIETPDYSFLIDCGLRPQEISGRLLAVGSSWSAIRAVVLTHTHGDHWNKYTLEHLRRLNIPLIAHAKHHDVLNAHHQYEPLRRANLVHDYHTARVFKLRSELQLRPLQVPHDSDPTFGFRIEGASSNGTWSLGYASDLGTITDEVLAWFGGVQVLALEFNHDVELQKASPRPRFLVNRVLGNQGHLSNAQAAVAVRTLVEKFPKALHSVLQLHLSKDCNRPELAVAAITDILPKNMWPQIVTGKQHEPALPVELLPKNDA